MPLPAVALEVRTVFPPSQNEVLPLTSAVGEALTVTIPVAFTVQNLTAASF